MYNSCKENKQPYKVTKIYDSEYNLINLKEYSDTDIVDLMSCRRFLEDESLELNEKLSEDDIKNINNKILKYLSSREKKLLNIDKSENIINKLNENNYKKQNHEISENIFNQEPSIIPVEFECSENINDINIAKKLVSIMSIRRASEYNLWLNVGFALHNTSNSLFSTFIEFSKKCIDKFDFESCKEYGIKQMMRYLILFLHYIDGQMKIIQNYIKRLFKVF